MVWRTKWFWLRDFSPLLLLLLLFRRSRCLLTFSFWKCCCCTCFCVITKGLSWIGFICLAVLCVWIFAMIPATGGSRAASPTWEGSFGCYLQLLASIDKPPSWSGSQPASEQTYFAWLDSVGTVQKEREGGQDGESSRVQAVTDKLLLAATWTKHDRRIQAARTTSVGK